MIVDVAEVGQRPVCVLPGRVIHSLRFRVAVEQLLERGLYLRRNLFLRMAGFQEQVAVAVGGKGARWGRCCGVYPAECARKDQRKRPSHNLNLRCRYAGANFFRRSASSS